ncbi:MAG: type IV secretory system conjugative DNA transfer family protein, partial [Pseudomonadota bacterium]
MAARNETALTAAFPALICFVFYTSFQAMDAHFVYLYMFGGSALFCALVATLRLLRDIKNSIRFRWLLKPKGVHGRVEHLNSHDPTTMGLHTDNHDRNGLPLGHLRGSKAKKLLWYKGDGHGLIAAGTGAGKTVSLSKNWAVALGKHHNRIITSKGVDIAVATYRYLTQELGHEVINIDPYRLLKQHSIPSDDFNPCDILVDLAKRQSTDIFDKAREIALCLIPEVLGASGENKIFRSVGKQFITSTLIYLAIEQSETGELVCNLAYLNRLLNSGTDDLLDVFQRMSIIPHYDGAIARAGKRFVSQFQNSPKSAQSFITEAQEAIAIFEPATPIGQACEYSTFNASDIKNSDKNITINIILPVEKSGINDQFAGLVLNSLCTLAIEADRFHPQVTIIADEFENLSSAPIPIIERVLKIGRTRGVRLFAFIQDQESLAARYGQLASMFKTQAAIFMAMDIRSVDEAEEYSKRSGQRAIVTDSANMAEDNSDYGVSVKEEGVPLMRLDAFTRMPKFTAVLFKEQYAPLML